MHTVSRMMVVSGSGTDLHLSLGCSHGVLPRALCGHVTGKPVETAEPPYRACADCGTQARRHYRGLVPRAAQRIVSEFGFAAPRPDRLAGIGECIEHLPPLTPEFIGSLGRIQGSRDGDGIFHADRFCVSFEDDAQEWFDVTLGDDGGITPVEGNARLHCHRFVSNEVLDVAVEAALVRSEREFLIHQVGPNRGWNLFLECQPPFDPVDDAMVTRLDVPLGGQLPLSVVEAHGTNRLLWDSLRQEADGWAESPLARQATDQMTALNALAHGNVSSTFSAVTMIKVSLPTGHMLFSPAGARVGVHGEIGPLGPIRLTVAEQLVEGFGEITLPDGSPFSNLPDWVADDVADFLVTQDLAVQYYAREMIEHCPGQVVSLSALPAPWKCWPHREHEGHIQCWVPATVLMAEHLQPLLSGPYVAEEDAERWLG